MHLSVSHFTFLKCFSVIDHSKIGSKSWGPGKVKSNILHGIQFNFELLNYIELSIWNEGDRIDSICIETHTSLGQLK